MKATSKASYREIKESGTEMSQSDKILEIINIGGTLSMQELMAIYRGKYGNIELSSISARCNQLKADGKIIEASPRKCSISDKTINPLTANKCEHKRYKTVNYMQYERAIKDLNICHIGMIEQTCKDCNADISFARRVRVMKADEYMRGIK